jgi:prephenate dehydrogenase
MYPWAHFHFVPCHPMAGKEKSGVKEADEKLYQGKIVFITPLKSSPRKRIQETISFWKKVQSIPVIISPDQHDRFVALTSHLPHLLAALLTNIYGAYEKRNPLIKTAIGSGFRDFTRIAAGNPSMWNDIFLMNRKEIKGFLGQYRKSLLKLEQEIMKTNSNYWKSFFEKSKKIREQI